MKYLIAAIIAYHIIGAIAWLFTEHKPAKTIKQIEAEHRQILREQERLAKAQEREEKARLAAEEKLVKEQEKQAAQLAKHEKQIQDLYFKVEKCEDEIAHFTELADTLSEQRDAMLEEIDVITKRLEHAGGELDPLNASHDSRFAGSRKVTPASCAARYMDAFATTLDDKRTAKQKQADADKLSKRRDTLQGKVIRLNNQIFAAEQRVKKATHEKDTAEKALSA